MSTKDPQKRAQEELDSILKEMEESAPTEAPHAAQADEPAPEQQTSEGDGDPTPADAQEIPQASPEPEQAGQPQAKPQQGNAAEQPTDAADTDTYRRRFETLQGKYNAEIPRLHAEVRALRRENESLQRMLTTRQQEPAPSVEDTPEFQAMVDEYGVDAARAMVGLAKVTSAQAAKAEVEPLAERVQAQTELSLNDRISKLAGADWLVVNDDHAFVEWVNDSIDRYSGQSFHALLNEAYESGDAARVAFFFNQFKELRTAPVNQPQVEQPNQPAPQTQPQAQSRPEAQPQQEPPAQPKQVTDQQAMVAPKRRATAFQSGTDNAPDKVWAASEIDAFYLDVSKGRYQGRTEEQRRIESEIEVAFQQGRVVG